MNIAEINQLHHAGLGRLTSDAYKAAFEDPITGKQFAEKVNALESSPRPTAARPAGKVGRPEAATPASTSFDPSFDDAPAPAAAAPAPAPAQPAAVPGNLLVWEYQPVDKQNRPVGGLQRFKYDPRLPNEHPQSLASQLTKAHSCATTALKEKKTQEFIESVQPETEYREPQLLSISDHPEAAALNAITETAIANGVMSALNLFKANHPEFVLGEANAAAMTSWVAKSKRNPADGKTWEAAWQALKPYLLPDEAEATAPAPAPAPVAAPAVRTKSTARVGTGLSNADVFNEEPVVAPVAVQGVKLVIDGKAVVMDLRSWERQSSDLQKRALRNASNASAIDALYRADENRKATRGGKR